MSIRKKGLPIALACICLASAISLPVSAAPADDSPALAMVTPGRSSGAAGASKADHRVTSQEVNYAIPDVRLVRQDGRRVSLGKEMNDGRAVVMNFIFTTCSAVCPLSSQTFAQFEHLLGKERDRVHLMSVSIDPEQDTPARLRAYARKFGATSGWQYYTGTLEASLTTQRAFGAYHGDKMSHTPLTLMRAADGKSWLRIDGFVTPRELLEDYHRLQAAR